MTIELVSGFAQLEVVYGGLGRRVVLSSDSSCDDGAEHSVYVEKSFDSKQFTLRVDGAEKTVSLAFVAGERDVLNTKVSIIKLSESINKILLLICGQDAPVYLGGAPGSSLGLHGCISWLATSNTVPTSAGSQINFR